MKDKIIKYLQDLGYSQEAVAGIVGNIFVETGGSFSYKQRQKGGGRGYGIFQFDFLYPHYTQWLKDRKDSLEAQLDFMHDTIFGEAQDTIGRGNAKRLRLALVRGDVKETTTAFMEIFEKPGVPHTERRVDAALSTYKELQECVEDVLFARPEDIPQIVSLGYKAFEETRMDLWDIQPSFEKAMTNVTRWVVEDVVLVRRNKENDRLIDGFAAMEFITPWWAEDRLLSMTLYYIKPEFRSFKSASNLLKAAQEYAIMNRLPLIMDLIGAKDIKKKIKLLKYLGFKEYGSFYIFVPTMEQRDGGANGCANLERDKLL